MKPPPLVELLLPAPELDLRAAAKAREHLNELTKPIGSLGRLEEIVVILASVTGRILPKVPRKAVIVFAADHGVTVHGVSAYPQEVTAQMLCNFSEGGAAINSFCRLARAELSVVNVGVKGTRRELPGVIDRIIRAGTRDFVHEPALVENEVVGALLVGADVTRSVIDRGVDLIAFGEMGIGNTTSASAITAIVCARKASEVTGRGAGLDSVGVVRKTAVVEAALQRAQCKPTDGLGVLAQVGGLEIAAITGGILAAVQKRVPVVIDGFVVGAAALLAELLVPGSKRFVVAGHQSAEPGHQVQLGHLGLNPLLKLDMRLGEGTGAVLAFHLIEAACEAASSMGTFVTAEVSRATSGSDSMIDSKKG